MERRKNVVSPREVGQTPERAAGHMEDKDIQTAMYIVDLAVDELMTTAPENVSVSHVVNRICAYIDEFGFGRAESLDGIVNASVIDKMSRQYEQLEDVKNKEQTGVTAAVGLLEFALRDLPESLIQDRLNENVCSGVQGTQLDKQAVVNELKNAVKQLLKGNYNDVKYHSSLLAELRNGNMSAATLTALLSRYNLTSDVGQLREQIYYKDVIQSIISEYRSLLLAEGDSNRQGFWQVKNVTKESSPQMQLRPGGQSQQSCPPSSVQNHLSSSASAASSSTCDHYPTEPPLEEERYNNNSEYYSGECDDNSENSRSKLVRQLMHVPDNSENSRSKLVRQLMHVPDNSENSRSKLVRQLMHVPDNSETSSSKLVRQLMHVPDNRPVSPQTPTMQNTQEHVCSQQTLSSDRSEAADSSHDDKLKMFMLHLDLSTLHENIDDVDSMSISQERPDTLRDSVSRNLNENNESSDMEAPGSYVMEAHMSPSAFYNHGIFRASLNIDEPPLPPVHQDLYKKYSEDECNYHMKQLTMKIQGLKKKIKRFEENFEMDHGYKPSQGEKTAQPHIKKYMSKLAKARKDLKRLKEDAENGNRSQHGGGGGSPFDARHPMAMTLDFILQTLGGKRPAAGKLDNIRPIMSLELQTVPEDEMMEIPISFTKNSIEVAEYLNQDDAENLDYTFGQQDMANFKNQDFSDMRRRQGGQSWEDNSSRTVDTRGDSHFHEMSLSELYGEIEFARAQKGSLRRAIRDFENDFCIKNGRKMKREDRFPLQSEYTDYKKVKGRIRLLEALILKHCE